MMTTGGNVPVGLLG